MIRFRIGCVDGNTYESDGVDEVLLQKHLDDNNGRIGIGSFDNVVVPTVEDFLQIVFNGLSGYDVLVSKGSKLTNFTMEINGQERTFLRDKVVWFEIIRGS